MADWRDDMCEKVKQCTIDTIRRIHNETKCSFDECVHTKEEDDTTCFECQLQKIEKISVYDLDGWRD